MQKMVLGWSFPCSGKKMGALQHFWFVTYSLLCFFSFCFCILPHYLRIAQVLENTCHQRGAWDVPRGSTLLPTATSSAGGGHPSSVTISVLRWLNTSFWQLCLYKTVLLTWIHYPLLFQGDNAKAIYINLCAVELNYELQGGLIWAS